MIGLGLAAEIGTPPFVPYRVKAGFMFKWIIIYKN